MVREGGMQWWGVGEASDRWGEGGEGGAGGTA